MFQFQTPLALLLFLSFPFVIYFYVKRQKNHEGSVKYSSIAILKSISKTKSIILRHSLFILRMLAISMIIIALARPQAGRKNSEIVSEGINIMLVLDTSYSMLAEDFRPSRIEAAKRVVESFINKRTQDRIGLVIFSDEAFVKCPLTLDYGVLNAFLKRTDIDEKGGGTAIGLGIATAVDALAKTESKSKVIILLTDGDNNAGEIDPNTAAEIAYTYDTKIYTIGMGKPGANRVWISVDHPVLGKTKRKANFILNDTLLKEIAKATEGMYFNAQNSKTLSEIYKQIDEIEKVKIKENQFMEYNELYTTFVLIGLIFILLEILLQNTRFRKIP